MQEGIVAAVTRRIEQLSTARDWTGYKLAHSAGIPYSTVKDILAGRSKSISITNIKAIADAFEMDIVTFFDTPEFRGLEQEIK